MTAFFVLQVALDTKKTVREPSREYSLFFAKALCCVTAHARARTFNGNDDDDDDDDDDDEKDVGD
jgi:hypothetical protein